MKKMLVTLAGVAFSNLLPTLAVAADASRGEAIAQRWCAGCHIVAQGQKASMEAPPFIGMAQRSDFDAARLAFFLLDPHPKMPNMQLSRADVADIAAYIAALK